MDVPASTGDQGLAFKSPKRFLSDLDATTTAEVIASAADVALIIDNGVIKDLAFCNRGLSKEGYDTVWRGKPWVDTVAPDSRQKILDLLGERKPNAERWRQVNHPSGSGVDIPVRYTTVRTGKSNRIVALGRDLRAISDLQQRLVETHQDLEREYAQLRAAEARYRLLFEVMTEPVLVVDAHSLAIEEANRAALDALAVDEDDAIGASIAQFFLKKHNREVERLAAAALSSGKSAVRNVVAANRLPLDVSASAFRHDESERLIVRLAPHAVAAEDAAEKESTFQEILESLPDGLVVTDAELRVLAANDSFLKMAQLVGKQQAVGETLAVWLGRSGTELNMLISNLKNYGVIRNFATILRDRFGGEEPIEVSAVAAPSEDTARYGFSIRSTARRLATGPRIGEELPSSVDQVTGLVGRMPLKEIVRESTDLIEKLCIETALEIAGDNRASAAEILGLSRQGLYSKLKRFGMDDS